MTQKTVKRRRWHRFAIPLGLVFALITGTVTVRLVTEPDRSQEHYLSPEKKADTSAVELVDLLRAEGVTIRRETTFAAALAAVQSTRGDATLFIPTPEFVRPEFLVTLRTSWSGTRVVMVEPKAGQLVYAVPALTVAGSRRWATKVTGPGPDCPLTEAGPAAVTRTRYVERYEDGPPTRACYEQGLVSIRFYNVEFVLAGSADPFRDDRLLEHDNAALAVDLLSTRKTLVWLDLHAMAATGEQELPPPSPIEFEEDPGPSRTRRDEPPSPFPPWLLPAVLMLLLIAIVVAIARGRRLGAPVTEPLPIDVRGAETAIGRSRLYRRAKARGAALETLRFEARRRLASALDTTTDREQLLDALQARLGGHRDRAADVLYGPSPESDDELRTRSADLLLLVERVTKGRS